MGTVTRYIRIVTVCTVAAGLWGGRVHSQRVEPDRTVVDTMAGKEQVEKSRSFYDKLKSKGNSSGFIRLLYKAFVTGDERTRDIDKPVEAKLQKETAYFSRYQGKRIDNILIFRNNVFEELPDMGWVRRSANSVHRVTRESKIRQNLLFKPGDTVSAEVLSHNEQLLRDLNFLSDAYIVVVPARNGGKGVDVLVFTRDQWTISADLHSRPEDNYYLDLYDNNFLGWGDRLSLRTYGSLSGKKYGGNMLGYRMSNMWGSFFNAEAWAGKGYEESEYSLRIFKDFILPTDYMAGGIAEQRQYYETQVLSDTLNLIRARNFDFWLGKSWYLPKLKGSFFVTAGYQNLKFARRPEVRIDTNTYYHSRQVFLLGTGIYRESFYRGNLIYGFGATENVPYGYKLELITGRYLGEFDNKWYFSLGVAAGRQTGAGYLRGAATGSTFVTSTGKFRQAALDVEVNYFTNLLRTGRNYVRQFASVSYLHGFQRYGGEGEYLTFYGRDSPRGYRNEEMYGTSRLVVNTETVLFTPIYFYGFRFAFFAFLDAAWIGNDGFIFGNRYYTSLGLGVRLKNERLIFNTIQLRFGFALTGKGFADYNYFRFSSESRLRMPGYKPEGPDLTVFR